MFNIFPIWKWKTRNYINPHNFLYKKCWGFNLKYTSRRWFGKLLSERYLPFKTYVLMGQKSGANTWFFDQENFGAKTNKWKILFGHSSAVVSGFLTHQQQWTNQTYPTTVTKPNINASAQAIEVCIWDSFQGIRDWDLGGGFKGFFIFTPTWGNDPIWPIFLGRVETTG